MFSFPSPASSQLTTRAPLLSTLEVADMKCAPEVEASADGTASAPTAMHRSTAKKSLRMFYLHKRISAVRLVTNTVDRVHAAPHSFPSRPDGSSRACSHR